MIKQYKLRFYNFRLVIFLLAISFIGIQLVGTAADYLRTRQLLGVIIGVVFSNIPFMTLAAVGAQLPFSMRPMVRFW